MSICLELEMIKKNNTFSKVINTICLELEMIKKK